MTISDQNGKVSQSGIKTSWIRRLVQFMVFAFFNAGLWGIGPFPLLLPVLVSSPAHSITVGDALSITQAMLSTATVPWMAFASFMILATIMGRSPCGWICPFGFLQDLLSYVRRRHLDLSLRTQETLKGVKYWALALTLLICLALGIVAATDVEMWSKYREAMGAFGVAPFDAVSPSGTVFAVLPQLPSRWAELSGSDASILGREGLDLYIAAFFLFFPTLLILRLALTAFTLAVAVYVPRFWCRYLCPSGAFSALFSRFAFLSLTRDPVKCDKCRLCVKACPMAVRILDNPWQKFDDPECVLCLECIEACPLDALKLRFK